MMSELKAKHVVDVYDDYAEHPCEELSQVYLKSEADKVIALLKDKANYNEYAYKLKSEELADACRFYEEELRHNKYKRCLAMALLWLERSENSTDLENGLVSRKRCSKWLELSEKFKPNSTAQQGKG